MAVSILFASLTVAVWALTAAKLDSWRLSAPLFIVLAGLGVGLTTRNSIAQTLSTEFAMRTAELILAVLLFVDATEVQGGLFSRHPGATLRILFIGLPLSIAAAVALGGWLFPSLHWAALLALACVVMPIDFAPAGAILRDKRIPARVRDILNVESGYNDGIVSPLLLFALSIAGTGGDTKTPEAALVHALPSAGIALVGGAALGAGLAVLANRSDAAALTTKQSRRFVVVAAPLIAFAGAQVLHGNGLVAAFVCGIAFRYLRSEEEVGVELQFLDDIGLLLTSVMWFVFGGVAVYALWGGFDWRVAVYSIVALTAARVIPVALAMVRSGLPKSEAMLLGWLGPRGTTSIVFGLMAFNALSGYASITAVTVMVVVVFGSIVLHGLGSALAVRRYRELADDEAGGSDG